MLSLLDSSIPMSLSFGAEVVPTDCTANEFFVHVIINCQLSTIWHIQKHMIWPIICR